MQLRGTYFDGKTSQSQECVVSFAEDEFLRVRGIDMPPVSLADIQLSSRIGNSARIITLPGGATIESVDHDVLEALEGQLGGESWFNIYRWESQLRYVAIAVAIIGVATFAMLRWGIPSLSHTIASSLPTEVAKGMASGAMDLLDEEYLETSGLTQERQASVLATLEAHLPKQSEFSYRILFRASPMLGANAFALPDGTIVLTDDFVELAERDEELLAVFFHEVGHVEHMHALRSAIASTGVAAVLLWVTGDLDIASGIVVAIPTILIQAGYSRGFEAEADDYSLQYMVNADTDPVHFASMIEKLQTYSSDSCERLDTERQGQDADESGPPSDDSGASVADSEIRPEMKDEIEPRQDLPRLECTEQTEGGLAHTMFDYLSTHPGTQARTDKFREASRQYHARKKQPTPGPKGL